MKITSFCIGLLFLYASAGVWAGSISNGVWMPNGCGEKPAAPEFDGHDAESYNRSVAAVNDWQEKSKVYFDCLVKEANGDNRVIADSANREQDEYRKSVDALSAVATSAKQKLENR